MSTQRSKSVDEYIAAIRAHLERLEALLPRAACKTDTVSAWSVGQHAEHVLSATSILAVLLSRNRKSDGKTDQSPIKHLLITHGSMPRGIAHAPEGTLPAPDPTTEDLAKMILTCSNRVGRLVRTDADAVVPHPYLGELYRDEALMFMDIHLNHHLSIIADIVKAIE